MSTATATRPVKTCFVTLSERACDLIRSGGKTQHRWVARGCPVGASFRPGDRVRVVTGHLTLEATAVRLQKLQDITPEDLDAEGFADLDAFRDAWGGTKGRQLRHRWRYNPTTRVVTFRRVD